MRCMLTSGCLSYSAAEGDDQFKLCFTVPKLGSKNHAPTVAMHIVPHRNEAVFLLRD